MSKRALCEALKKHDLRRWMRMTKGGGELDYLQCYCGEKIFEDSKEAMLGHVADAILASRGSQSGEFYSFDDELRQCLQIIIANAGNIKDDRNGPILEGCIAIENAVERAARALCVYAVAGKATQEHGISGPRACPVCSGRGNVPQGFYNCYVQILTTAPLPELCRTCGGDGVLWQETRHGSRERK